MSGSTGQRLPVKLVVHARTVKLIRFVAKLRCEDGSTLVDYESDFQPTPLRGGRLRDHQSGSTDDVWIRGRVQGRRVRGTLRVEDKLNRGVHCDSHWFRFDAHARR